MRDLPAGAPGKQDRQRRPTVARHRCGHTYTPRQTDSRAMHIHAVCSIVCSTVCSLRNRNIDSLPVAPTYTESMLFFISPNLDVCVRVLWFYFLIILVERKKCRKVRLSFK